MFLVRAVWIMLCFETYRCTLWINDSFLSFDCSIEEIAGVNLDTWLVGIDFQRDAGIRASQLSSYLMDISLGL